MRRKLYVIVLLLLILTGFTAYSQIKKGNQEKKEPEIAVMYAHPELAEDFAKTMIQGFAPEPETLRITYCKAQFIPLYRAYVVKPFQHK